MNNRYESLRSPLIDDTAKRMLQETGAEDTVGAAQEPRLERTS
jgi:hypothetical protein